jgi:hypothetical protein
MEMIYAAMFDAVNSIARRYQPYLVHNCPQTRPRPRTPRLLQLPRQVLAAIDEKSADAMKVTRDLSRVDPGPRIGESGWHQACECPCLGGLSLRFSTRVGTDMGLKIGDNVVTHVMLPALTGGSGPAVVPQRSIPVA